MGVDVEHDMATGVPDTVDTKKIPHGPKYPKPWELWYYRKVTHAGFLVLIILGFRA